MACLSHPTDPPETRLWRNWEACTPDMDEYGLPAPYSFAVEELIAQKVDELVRATGYR